MKKIALVLIPFIFAHAHAMLPPKSNQTSQAEGLEKALRKNAQDKLLALAQV